MHTVRAILQGLPNDAMKKWMPLLTVVHALAVQGQNLVPNGSFEEYSVCPTNFSQIGYATGWTPFRVTPDYYNACSPNDSAGVPLNILGYQAAATGFAYAGIWCYFESTPPNGREFMGIALTQPLVPGIPLHLSFQTVFASSAPPDFYQPKFNCTGIGLRFTMEPFTQSLGAPVPNEAAAHLGQLITDSVGWTLVEGTYVPDSAYQYVVVGNFYDDASIVVDEFDPDGNIDGAYFYVDDVCVTQNPGSCGFTGVGERALQRLYAWPNPFCHDFRVWGLPAALYPVQITLRDISGRVLWSELLSSAEQSIVPTVELGTGIYQATIASEHQKFAPILLLHLSP